MRISDWSSDVCSPDLLSAANGAQAPVLVHRDFHSPNLMVCDDPAYGPNPGVLDFQDALAGPVTYDLASLVTDARTTWEEPQQRSEERRVGTAWVSTSRSRGWPFN